MEELVRQLLLKLATGEKELVLTNRVPSLQELGVKFQSIDTLGLYLHIPSCEQICPYCPYNRELYHRDKAERYARAVMNEVDFYANIVGNRPITSFYIGGGTPTTMLRSGLADIIEHIRNVLNLQCDIHMESHPNHLSLVNLRLLKCMGVEHLSIGVEALQDRHLRFLCRNYTSDDVKQALGRAVSQCFRCVNVDIIFALPNQTCQEIEQTGQALVEMGVDQVAAYPLFRFPHTHLGSRGKSNNEGVSQTFRRRRMLGILERIFYGAGYERSSVWAFTKRGVPRYCSVTVPLYLGLGASGSSYLRDVFYLNTFSASDYIKSLEDGCMAIGLSLDLPERMQRAGWLYWRVYETILEKASYQERFGEDVDQVYSKYLKLFSLLGLLRDDGEWLRLSDRGSFWLHACEDILSIDYISKLWGRSSEEPWPRQVTL